MKNTTFIFLALFLIGLSSFVYSTPLTVASADDLIVKDNGAIDLILTNGGVLAATTIGDKGTNFLKRDGKLANPPKVVSITPAHSQNKVLIDPKQTKDKKLTVTIVPSAPPVVTPGAIAPGVPVPSMKAPASSVANPPASIQKVVDQVIAQDASGAAVLTVKPADQQGVSIQQAKTVVSTSLPLQIDSLTHALSVITSAGSSTKVSVLPTEAVNGANSQGVIDRQVTPVVTLLQGQNQVVYQVKGTQTGKLFGIVDVSAPSRVDISAETGKVISVQQSPVFSLFGFLIK